MTSRQQTKMRREFLGRTFDGLSSIALLSLLGANGRSAVSDLETAGPYQSRPAHFPPQADNVIVVFCCGAVSQMDTFDFKPELIKRDGQPLPDSQQLVSFQGRNGNLVRPLWKFRPRGNCGKMISDLTPHLAELADDFCFIHSLHSKTNTHGPGESVMSTGFTSEGFPSMGAWVTFALGSENENLPAFVAIEDPRGIPQAGPANWSAGFLPAAYQGTPLNSRKPVQNLLPPNGVSPVADLRARETLGFLNKRHMDKNPGDMELQARIASYELAARMQTSAREALDISQETRATQDLYGIHDNPTREYGTRCLIARRLIERGVRFVQLFLNYQPWDNHSNIRASLPSICRKTDKPSAGLVKDLKQRGLLDQTIVHWGGEIGRLPVIENHGDIKKCGRDHNGQGFSTWFAGGGFKAGIAYGQTDEFGHRSVVDKVSPHDYQATLLHLFGIDHRQLKYLYNAQDQMLTDHKDCRVVRDILV